MKPTVLPLALILILGTAALAAAQNAPVRLTKIKVTAEQANLREKPDIGSGIVQQVPEGTVLEAERKEGEWFFVRYTLEDGGVIGGYIHESLVEIVEGGAPVEAVKAPDKEAPPKERVSKPFRIGKIKPPEFKTGGFPLEFAVSAGAALAGPNDLNDGTRGYADWNAAELGIPGSGSAAALRFAFLAGFDLSYRLSPKLAIGLGADFLHGANRASVVYTDPLITETLVTNPSARAVQVKLSVRFYPGAGFYVRGGLGVYSVKAGYLYRLLREDAWQQWKGSATGSGIGAEAVFGGEWEIAPRTSLFAEGGAHLARFRKLTGKDVYSNSTGESRTEPGTLYFFHKVAADTNTYPLLFVSGSAPADAVDYRPARLDLSGMAVRAGIRYRF